jgi:hypothetical protein
MAMQSGSKGLRSHGAPREQLSRGSAPLHQTLLPSSAKTNSIYIGLNSTPRNLRVLLLVLMAGCKVTLNPEANPNNGFTKHCLTGIKFNAFDARED